MDQNLRARILAGVLCLWAAAPAVPAASVAASAAHPGEALYRSHCAACHDNGQALRAPSLATLKAMRYQAIYFALTGGKMQDQARALSSAQRAALIDYLVGRQPASDAWIERLRCPLQQLVAAVLQLRLRQ